MAESLTCRYAEVCSGCDLIHLNREELRARRFETLDSLGIEAAGADYRWIRTGGLRDWLEFTLDPQTGDGRSHFGLFDRKFEPGNKRGVVDLETCPQLSTPLEMWLWEFRTDRPPVRQRTGVRLRVSPLGLRGIWIDGANVEILSILEEQNWLDRMFKKGVVVEVGQRHKRVIENESTTAGRKYRLSDQPRFEPWFETIYRDGSVWKKTPVFGAIGTFTQPGFESVQNIAKEVVQSLDASLLPIAEFGGGSGSMTIPLATLGRKVDVFEFDQIAISASQEALSKVEAIRPELINFNSGDFISSDRRFEEAIKSEVGYGTVVVDPPRAGLGRFLPRMLDHLKQTSPPKLSHPDWVYVSCFPESFAKDFAVFKDQGYLISRLTILEQFPFTRHFEMVAQISRTARPR